MAPSEGKALALGQLKAVARHPRTQWRSVSRWSAAQGTGQDANVVTNEDLAAKAVHFERKGLNEVCQGWASRKLL